MSDETLNHKLVEAIPEAQRNAAAHPVLDDMPGQTHADIAEQTREAQESQAAHNAQGGVKDRLIDIGKANHMGGHSTGRKSDS